MTRPHVVSGALVASLLSVAVAGQTANQSADTDLPLGPLALSGLASSARHCVSGDAANVHGIGWVAADTSFTITFDSEITLATGVVSLDFSGSQATSAFGTPDLRFTASTPGSMVLYVGGRGRAGCYRYKVEIQPPSPSLAPVSESRMPPAVELVKPAKYPIRMMAISGAASSAKHCVTGNAAKIHGIGRVEQGADVRITFDSDFDPIAGVSLLNFDPERSTYLIDDDTGGDLEPLLHFTASQSGTLALHVGSYGETAGCYHYQVQIQGGAAPVPTPTPTPTPSPTPTPTPTPSPTPGGTYDGTYRGTFSGQANGTIDLSVTNSVIAVTQPSSGSGRVDSSGTGTFSARIGSASCTFSGRFTAGSSASGGGSWTCPSAQGTSRTMATSGTWTAPRVPDPVVGGPPLTPFVALTGTWRGTFTSATGGTCEWTGGSLNSPAITLVLQQSGSSVTGTITTNLTPTEESLFSCPTYSGYTLGIVDGLVSSDVLTFFDGLGSIWRLNATTTTGIGGTLVGNVTPKSGGTIYLRGRVHLVKVGL